MDTILVTGGSGFLGHNLCRHLLGCGYAVRNLDVMPFDYPEIKGVETIQGDIRDPAALARAMTGVRGVVHCAAALPRDPADLVHSVNAEGTRLVLEAARASSVDRFVFISSTAVYGVPDKVPLREDDRLVGLGPYGEAKIAAEAHCASIGSAMNTVVLRPKSFIGKGRLGLFDVVFDWVCSGKNIPLIGSGMNRYQLLDVDDLCNAIELVLTGTKERVGGQIFNVGTEDFGTMRSDVEHLLQRAGFGKRVVPLPIGPIIATLRVLEKMHLSPLYSWVYETAGKDSYVAVDKLKAATGWRSIRSNREALVACYLDYVQHVGDVSRYGTGHRARWNQGALTLAKFFF